jgi:L-seryl-tRNA(Ser) seleniumtransferase
MPDTAEKSTGRAALPSVDAVLRASQLRGAIERHGRPATVAAVRQIITALRSNADDASPGRDARDVLIRRIAGDAEIFLDGRARGAVRPVFNLTGTVLHTNLGRAVLPEEAVAAVIAAARRPNSLEFDLETGRRGDRERGVAERLIRLTGAEDATFVNNNAAAVLLALDTLAKRREVPVSRGELVEIGGAFRMPDIMTRAGCRMREVGTTNRTHLKDYADAITPRTGLLLKVHTSNYVVSGFTASVGEAALADLGRAHGIPLMVDLGSGALVDLETHGLPHEPTPMEMLGAGADLVTFSGDKLLGGPQAGLIVGRRDLIAKLKRNPLKRALRLDKMTLAALDVVLRLYENPERLTERVPTLRYLSRPASAIKSQATRLVPDLQAALGPAWAISVVPVESEVGSGSLPGAELDSSALAVRPAGRGGGAALRRLAARFRGLPVPVVGRVSQGAFLLDLRCLDDEDGFCGQLTALAPDGDAP